MRLWLIAGVVVVALAAYWVFHAAPLATGDLASNVRDTDDLASGVVGPEAADSIPQWSVEIDLPAWVPTAGPGTPVELLVDNPEDRDDDYFRERYAGEIAFLTANQEALKNIMVSALHEFRLTLRREIVEFFEEYQADADPTEAYVRERAEEARQPVTEADTRASLTLDYIFLFDQARDGHYYVGYRFSWDQGPKRAVGLLMCGDRVIEVGQEAGWMPADEEEGDSF